MKLLLDTHALLWWAHDPARLSGDALDAISDGSNDVYVSPVSAMEIATKSRKGKLAYDSDLSSRFVDEIAAMGFSILPIDGAHAVLAASYQSANQDPWDRLLAAQAQIEALALVSCDEQMPTFGVRLFWETGATA